jgi:hypothetical protein
VIWFCGAVTAGRRRNLEPPGSTGPGRVAFATRPAIPDGPPAMPRSIDLGRVSECRARTDRGRNLMAAKPKPQNTDDAREQARRALQTSLDTRQ